MSHLLPNAVRMLSACRLGALTSQFSVVSSNSIVRPIIFTGFRQFSNKESPRRRTDFRKFRKIKSDREKSYNPVKEQVESAPEVNYTPEELVPGKAMLERIISDLEKNSGSSMILPKNDDLINDMLKTIEFLINKGVAPQFVISACSQSVILLKALTVQGEKSLEILDMLISECLLTYEDSLRVFYSCGDDILNCDPATVRTRLDAIIACGVNSGRPLQRVVKGCPPVIYASDPEAMKRLVESMADFFSRKEIFHVIMNAPEIIMKNMSELEEKYEYIFYQMHMESSDFCTSSRWALLDLSDIILRHEFLQKCGKYTVPDAKRPQTKMENPDLSRILDTPDSIFATQVARVSLEEWITYKSFAEKESRNADKERLYERVKPSMRKAYERRHKQAQQLPDHVFDVASQSE